MTLTLNSHLLLLAFSPLTVFAQVQAGDPSGMLHTIVGVEIDPPVTTFYNSSDSADIDLEGDGIPDLEFRSFEQTVPDAVVRWNSIELLHAGMEVAMKAPDSRVAKRLQAGDLVDAGLVWGAFDGIPGNGLPVAGVMVGIAGAMFYGVDEWWSDEPVEVEGYIGVRIVVGEETRYGWIGLSSLIGEGASMRISDMAIEDGTTRIAEPTVLDRISARTLPDGDILLQGPLFDVERTVLHDASGRAVYDVGGSAPQVIDLSEHAPGPYVLELINSAGRRSIKLIRSYDGE
ncbi:MAG: hypothetical protein JNM62_15525 [Flavobacteriales bacterium]|nr:hypothetical protein [Flavobacteriales bacterium]